MTETLVDNLVGERQQPVWDHQAERFGCLDINYKIELSRLQHRKIGGPLALENPARIDADLAPCVFVAGAVAHRSAGLGVFPQFINGGDFVACSESGQRSTGK
jgi:hypothetical protein